MPNITKDDMPAAVRPYVHHGLDLTIRHDEAWASECPFCGGRSKWSVNVETGQWKCVKCSTGNRKGGGEILVFMRELYAQSKADPAMIGELRLDRKLLHDKTLADWGVVRHPIMGEPALPAYNVAGDLVQLYRYASNGVPGKRHLLCTAGTDHGLHGVNLYDPKKPDLYLCEGPWDAKALWEVLRITKRTEDGGLALTSSSENSLAATANVLATPGASVFKDSWCPLFSGKRVFLLFDNDHPKKTKNGTELAPAGYAGMRRVAEALSKAADPPAEVHYLDWSGEGKDHDPNLSSGYDLRDWITRGGFDDETGQWSVLPVQSRLPQLLELLNNLRPVPTDWVPGRSPAAKAGGVSATPLPCSDWKTLHNAWRVAMKWGEGLDRAMIVMLATCASTRIKGDQLWSMIMSPPSGGKTSLCEGISIARRYAIPKDTMTGLFSGFAVDAGASEDFSLAAKMRDKTLVVKDGDTILQQPNLPQILSQLRGLYDRAFRTSYGNAASREYEDLNTTVILCGTSSLRALDTSELGERFIKCSIMDGIDEDLETEINWRKLNQLRNLMRESPSVGGGDSGGDSPAMARAKCLTGGYVEWLRENVEHLVRQVDMDDAAMDRIDALGKFVAYLRTRESVKQKEEVQRELSTRLVSQLARLGYMVTVVLNRKSLDAEVLRVVHRCALDTARGTSYDICRSIYDKGEEGVDVGSLAVWAHLKDDAECRKWLNFLKRKNIGIVEQFAPPVPAGARQARKRWRLTARFQRIWEDVHREEQ